MSEAIHVTYSIVFHLTGPAGFPSGADITHLMTSNAVI
jgi:hypothetical protein